MAVRGPTREALQGQCVVAPVKDVQNLRSYFHGVRQLLFQGEAYYVDGQLVEVSCRLGLFFLRQCRLRYRADQ